MLKISENAKQLIKSNEYWYKSIQSKDDVLTIHIDEVAVKAASFYEKLRKIVDWKEEHLMRRSAIERIFRRRILLKRPEEEIAESFIGELIKSGHFPNDQIEQSKIEEVQLVLNKYSFILGHTLALQKKNKLKIYNWISRLAACEIEEVLDASLKERALLNFMYVTIKERINVDKGVFQNEDDKVSKVNNQIYIAVHRALFKLDNSIISYHLIKRKYLNWKNIPKEELTSISENIYEIWESIQEELNNPVGNKFYKICEKYDTPFLLLGDFLAKNPLEAKEKLEDEGVLENEIRNSYSSRLSTLKRRLERAAFYSTLSIFTTNLLSLLVIEIPLAKIITGSFNFTSIVIDVAGPTLLMFLLVKTVKSPGEGNLERVILESTKIVYEREGRDTYEIKATKRRSFMSDLIITIFYLFSLLLFFGSVGYVFQKINFPPTSYIINICFLALIAFAGSKIRERSKELTVEEEKEGFFSFITDIFTLPIIGMGRWLSSKWQKYNALTAFFNVLIDMPFSMFIGFIESWRSFLKEKKEELH